MKMKKRWRHQARQCLILALAMVMSVPPTALQQLRAAEPSQPKWVGVTTDNIKRDFESRLDDIEGDPTRSIVAGHVVGSDWRWANSPAIQAQPGTAYYVESPDVKGLDTMAVRNMAEAQSAYAAAMNTGRWDKVQIAHVQPGKDGLALMEVGGEEMPILAYDSVEEIGSTQEDQLVTNMWRKHLLEIDPSGELLLAQEAEEEAWLASLGMPEQQQAEGNVHFVSLRGRSSGCQPCNIERLPTPAQGNCYAYQPSSSGGQYRQCQPTQQYSRSSNCEDCNLGLLAGPRNLFNGNFIKNRPRKQADFMRLRFGQRLFARAFPRLAYRRGLVGCTTAQGLLGQRFLMILIGVSVGVGAAGGGAAGIIFLGQTEPDVEVPDAIPTSPSQRSLETEKELRLAFVLSDEASSDQLAIAARVKEAVPCCSGCYFGPPQYHLAA